MQALRKLFSHVTYACKIYKNDIWQKHYRKTALIEVYCSGGCLYHVRVRRHVFRKPTVVASKFSAVACKS